MDSKCKFEEEVSRLKGRLMGVSQDFGTAYLENYKTFHSRKEIKLSFFC